MRQGFISKTAKYMLLSLLVLFIFFAALGMAVMVFVVPLEPPGAYLRGLLLGCSVTALRLVMLDRSIQKAVDLGEKRAGLYHTAMMFLRYGLLIALAAVLIKFSATFGVYGAVVGTLCMQLSAYGANMLLGRDDKKKKMAN